MEFTEIAPLKELYYLQSLNFNQFKAYAKSSDKNDTERKESFQRVQNYCDQMIFNNGTIKRVYENDKTCDGRRRAKYSPATLPSIVRNFIFGSSTTDLDMKNAQPTILRWLCKLYNVPCPELDHYIKNRDYLLSKGDRDKLKTQYLCAYTSEKETISKNKNFIDYDNEAKRIQKIFYQLPDFREIINSIPEDKSNKLGSAISRILSNYENIILEKVIQFIKNKNIEICALIFDGMLIYGNHYENKNLLIELENFINNEFEGINMKFDFKEQKNIIIIPDNFEIPLKIEDNDIVTNDVQASEKIFKLYPNWVCCNDDLYVYDKDTGMWSSSQTIYYKIFKLFYKELTIVVKGKNGYETTDKSYGSDLHLMDRLPKLIKTLCVNNNWINEVSCSSLGKILFNNGFYDFNAQKFYEKTENGFNSPEIFFVYKINHDFTNFTDEDIEYIASIKKRLFYDPLGVEQGDCLAINIARGLAGDKMKRMIMGLGSSNCGKSILSTAIMLSCGEYAGSFNAESLAYRNTNSDEAQVMRWALLLRYKRIIISNELKSTTELNGNTIKKVASGGDTLVGRTHGKEEQEFVLHALSMVMANDLPKIKPYDDAVNNRLRIVSYNKVFVDEPTNEYELKADRNIENELRTLRFQKCFIGLLIQEHFNWVDNGRIDIEPTSLLQAKNEWIEQDISPIASFINDFEITNNENDYILSEEIQSWLDNKKLGITITKFGIELNKHIRLNKLENVISKNKKIGGKVKKAWFGIKSNNSNEDE
jgi:hypothetical protein